MTHRITDEEIREARRIAMDSKHNYNISPSQNGWNMLIRALDALQELRQENEDLRAEKTLRRRDAQTLFNMLHRLRWHWDLGAVVDEEMDQSVFCLLCNDYEEGNNG